MVNIAAYHSVILVRCVGEVVELRTDLVDWYCEGEVLGKLGVLTGCGTVGELVEAVRGESFSSEELGVISCCIEECATDQGVYHDWDELI